MSIFEKFKSSKTPKTLGDINLTNVELQGGMSPEQVLKERMAQWTPKQKAAALFLEHLGSIGSNWQQMLAKMSPEEKANFVEKFAKKPREVFPSASYDEKNERFVAEGSVSTGTFSG